MATELGRNGAERGSSKSIASQTALGEKTELYLQFKKQIFRMSDEKSELERNAIYGTFRFLGLAVGVLSLTSLVQRIGHITVSDFLIQFVDYYRTVADAAKYALFDWWIGILGIRYVFPSWLMDVVALWGLSFASLDRALCHDEVVALYGGYPKFGTRIRINWSRYKLLMFLTPVAWLFENFRSLKAAIKLRATRRNPDATISQEERLKSVVMDQITHKSGEAEFSSFVWNLAPFIGTVLFFLWNSVLLSS